MRVTDQYGVSLIEVLVSLLVLSIGLLGSSALLTQSMQMNQQANFNTQASLLLQDISQRMQANPMQSYAVSEQGKVAHQWVLTCQLRSCQPDELRDFDLQQWKFLLQQQLPFATGRIELQQNKAIITITWQLASNHEAELSMEVITYES